MYVVEPQNHIWIEKYSSQNSEFDSFVEDDDNHHACKTSTCIQYFFYWRDYVFQEAMEIMVACSAMALSKEQASKEEETQSPKSQWTKWKRGGIIGAAALTGGTLMAITGGMAPSRYSLYF